MLSRRANRKRTTSTPRLRKVMWCRPKAVYGNPGSAHCCLEAHGQVAEWQGDEPDRLGFHTKRKWHRRPARHWHPRPAARNVRIVTPVMGGGFGSKFAADSWGVEAALLSKASGGKPVKMFLDRGD